MWANTSERQRDHRQRKAAVYRALGELILAVINADLDDPDLQQQIDAAAAAADDLSVVQALTAYYRTRHWQTRFQKT